MIFKRRRVPVGWDLDRALLQLAPRDLFTIRDAFAAVALFGATGAGKTSGPGRLLARSYLSAGMGGLVLCAKADEADTWRQHAHMTGRTSSLVVVSPESPHRINFLEDSLRRCTKSGTETERVVTLLMVAAEAADKGQSGQGATDPFWSRSLRTLLRSSVDLLRLADEPINLRNIVRVVLDAPRSRGQLRDAAYTDHSYFVELLERASSRVETSLDTGDLQSTADYFCMDFAELSEKTRSSITSMLTTIADGFLRGVLREMFSTVTTLDLAIITQGAVVVLDLPTKTFSDTGRISQVLIKRIVQDLLEARPVCPDTRPIFIWADEAQEFLTDHDAIFQATARSSRTATVMLTQSLPGIVNAIGGRDPKAATEALLANFGTKVWASNTCPATNEWAERLLAKRWTHHATMQQGDGRQPHDAHTPKRGGSISSSVSESLDAHVLSGDFLTLRTGGPRNGNMVETLLTSGGRIFESSGTHYLRVTFDQLS